MIQDIKTAKKDNFCGLCRYCLYEDKHGGFVCHNEKSVMYGEFISDIGNENCDDYSGHRYTEMSLKEALKIVTQGGSLWSFPGLPDGDTKPFLGFSFENNEEFADWRDAFTRLFTEYMRLAKEDGDFNE